MRDDDDDEDDDIDEEAARLKREQDLDSAIERRRHMRAPVTGLSVKLAGRPPFETIEASRRSFFLALADPESFRLGDTFDAAIERGGRTVRCKLEVVRKEIQPRRGCVLRVLNIDMDNDTLLRDMLGVAGEGWIKKT